MWEIRWQILGVSDGATTQWRTYVSKNRMKRQWTISRQQNSLYFCMGSSRTQEWSDDSPRAKAHVYTRLAFPFTLAWTSLAGTIKNWIWGVKTDCFAVQTIPRPQHNRWPTIVSTIIISVKFVPYFRCWPFFIIFCRTRALRKVCQSNPHKVQKYHPEAFVGGKWLW